jgi:hypothetical protein
LADVALTIDGRRVDTVIAGSGFTAAAVIDPAESTIAHSEWMPPFGPLVIAVVATGSGQVVGAFVEVAADTVVSGS